MSAPSPAPANDKRPPIHLLTEESELVANIALKAEQRQPSVAAMLLEEIDRAESIRRSRINSKRNVSRCKSKRCGIERVIALLRASRVWNYPVDLRK